VEYLPARAIFALVGEAGFTRLQHIAARYLAAGAWRGGGS
jgi:hypothetical protein